MVFLTSPISGDRRQRRGARHVHRHRPDRAAVRQRHHAAADHPTARVTLGSGFRSRLYLTYARTLTGRADATSTRSSCRVRPERSDFLDPVEERRPFVRPRLPHQARLQMTVASRGARRTRQSADCRCVSRACRTRRIALDRTSAGPIAAVELRIEGKPERRPRCSRSSTSSPASGSRFEGWRRVAARFMRLPRFQNVTVFVEDQPSGVRLVFDLEPSHPIDKLDFPGSQVLRRPISTMWCAISSAACRLSNR